MAITSAVCTSFKGELLEGTHDFSSHTFKIALYSSSASLGASTTAYSTSNEVSASGTYSAGGGTLTKSTGFPKTSGTAGIMDFADISFTSATITARGALIYNDSASGDPAVCVLNFGSDKSSSSGTFTISFPTGDVHKAIIRIT